MGELKIETNLPEFRTMKVTSAGPAKTFWFNGEEKATVNFDTSSKTASHTMHLPSGKDLTIDLAWPKMTADASDLEFGVTITPDRKVVTKFGWEWAGVNKVYLDVVGSNPLQDQVDRPWRDHQGFPSQGFSCGDQCGHQCQYEEHEG